MKYVPASSFAILKVLKIKISLYTTFKLVVI